MDFVYPLDPSALYAHASKRGDAFLTYGGIGPGLSEDLLLTRMVWGYGQGLFPLMPDGTRHLAVDIGIPAWEDATLEGAEVRAVARGKVVHVDRDLWTLEGTAQNRVVIEHATADGGKFYALYQNLHDVTVFPPLLVTAGMVLGHLGFHGDFPHLHFAVVSPQPLGDDSLGPDVDESALKSCKDPSNVHRVKVEKLDELEWPGLPAGRYYAYNPIEFVRFCQGKPYQHDFGRAPGVPIAIGPSPVRKGLTAGTAVELKVDSVFVSAVLKGTKALQSLACDPDFVPLGPQSPADVVKELQTALAAVGSAGRAGSDLDGIDGNWATVEPAVRHFQKEVLKDVDLQPLGKPKGFAPPEGRVDWVTLMAIDAAATAKELHVPVQAVGPGVKRGPAIPPRFTEPPSGTFLFDPTAGTSLRFGMKMYQALLRWERQPPPDHKGEKTFFGGPGTLDVGYSAASAGPYESHPDQKYLDPEWPDLEGQGVRKESGTVGGYKTFNAFGCVFKGTNYTNCCNSQLAAFAVATGGEVFCVRQNGAVDIYDYRFPSGKPWLFKTQDGDGAPALDTNLLPTDAFERLFVTRYTDMQFGGGSVQDPNYAGMLNAIEFMHLGQKTFGKKEYMAAGERQTHLKKLLLGDVLATPGHAYMAGDIRYGVWLGDGKQPDFLVDQSNFLDGDGPRLQPGKGNDPLANLDGERIVVDGDCEALMKDDSTFVKRVQSFLGSTMVDGKPVKKIEVLGWRVWTANGTLSTFREKAERGITRPFRAPPSGSGPKDWICAGRYYRGNWVTEQKK